MLGDDDVSRDVAIYIIVSASLLSGDGDVFPEDEYDVSVVSESSVIDEVGNNEVLTDVENDVSATEPLLSDNNGVLLDGV